MPTPEQVGTRWVHPKGQVRYYVDVQTLLGIDTPEKVKVWMDRYGEVHVSYCEDKDLESHIVKTLDKYMRGDRKVIGLCARSNTKRAFRVSCDGDVGHCMTYDNIESARKRILTLRKKGQHIYRIQREETRFGEVYRIQMHKNTHPDGRNTPGYQAVEDDFGECIWYHGQYYWQ